MRCLHDCMRHGLAHGLVSAVQNSLGGVQAMWHRFYSTRQACLLPLGGCPILVLGGMRGMPVVFCMHPLSGGQQPNGRDRADVVL